MKKLLALVLAMACALSLGIPTLAKSADYTWNQVNVEDFVDEDGDKIADDDVIRPGQTIYWVFGKYSDYDYLLDSDLVKIDVDKDEGSKNIDGKPKVVGKKLGDKGRCVALEIVIKDTYTADELKTKLDIYITAKKNLVATNAGSGKFPIYKEGDYVAPDDLDAKKTALEKDIKDLKDALPALETALTNAKTATDAWNATVTVNGVSVKISELETKRAAAESAATEATRLAGEAGQKATAAETAANEAQGKVDAAKTAKGTADGQFEAAKNAFSGTATVEVGSDPSKVTYTVTIGSYNGTAESINGWTVSWNDGEEKIGTVADQNILTEVQANTTVSPLITAYDTAAAEIEKQQGIIDSESAIVTQKTQEKQDAEAEAQEQTTEASKQTALKDAYAQAKTDNGYDAKKAAFEALTTTVADAQKAVDEKKTAIKDKEDELAALEAGHVVGTGYLPKNDTMKVPMTIWIQNENRVDDDATFIAGEKGVVIKPVKNEENTVTWEDNNDTLAIMKFTADSDVEYYMPRLATKWNNEDYLDYFDDMDAYIRSFVGNPSIPCTSRARLWINNPFVDDDDEETIDPDDIYVYEVVDGELYDITDKVEYTTNDDDDYAFLIKTRTLGTYIFSDGPADIEDEDDDDYDPEAPDKVEVNNNKKPVPPTGF